MKKMYLLPLLGILLMFGCQDQMEEISIQDEAMKPNKLKAEEMGSSGRMILTNDLPINEDCETGVTDLVAGQHNIIGKIVVTKYQDNGSTMLKVEVKTDPGCGIGLVHISVKDNLDEIPATPNGKAIPGHFEHQESFSPMTDYAMKSFDITNFSGEAFVAVHAETDCSEGIKIMCEPQELSVKVLERRYTPTYFNFEINNEEVGGWCINFDEAMNLNKMHDVKMLASTCADMELLKCLFPNAYDKIGAINWMINQELKEFNSQAIQIAIWTIMKGEIPNNTYLPEYKGNNRTDAQKAKFYPLVEMALKHFNFVPGCGEYVAMLLYNECSPSTNGWQTSIIKKKIACGGEETAWGSGQLFVNRGDWGMYNTFELCK